MFFFLIQAVISRQIFNEVPLYGIVDQLLIHKDPVSLRINYCLNISQNLTNSQFNYPDVKQILQINNAMLSEYFDQSIIKKISIQGAINYNENERCKQFTIYSYNGQFVNQVNSIQNKIKRMIQNNQQQFDNSSWKYSLTNTIEKDQFINFNGEFQSTLQYKYQQKLFGAGLHQQLQTKIIFNQPLLDNDILIVDELDQFTYVDKDELDKLFFQTQLMTIIDIEKPTELSTQHIMLSKHSNLIGKTEIIYEVPYHFRYHLAQNQHYKQSFVPNIPRVYLIKKVNNTNSLQDILKTSIPIQVQEYQQHLIYEIPVGFLPYKHYIFIITIGVTLGMALYIAKLIVKSK